MPKATDRKTKRSKPKAKGASQDQESISDAGNLGSVGKALAVLEAVARSREPTGAPDLVDSVGLTRPTAHRISTLLAELGYLDRDPVGRGFIEGPRLVALALATLSAAVPRGIRHTALEDLSRQTGESVIFCTLTGADATVIDAVTSPMPLSVQLPPGTRIPLHTTAVGHLLMSRLPVRDRKRLLDAAALAHGESFARSEENRVLDAVEAAHSQGFAIVDGIFIDGAVCVGALVEVRGEIVGVVAVTGPRSRLTAAKARTMAPVVQETAKRIAHSFESP